ncbi:MAG: glycerol-3-phosphate 1-O-acyltransferase PlsY [Bacilli bacterium]|nr:glycerol-3-phosphate 1-O-acyltransferase PlsY [Bacilli bacterium]
MNILLNILVVLGCLVWGFLIGSIPTGVIVGKVFFGIDPRDYGSHNSGGTNSGRVLGKKVGILVMVLDIAKTVLAFWTVWLFLHFGPINLAELFDNGVLYNYLVCVAAAFGHCFSPFLKFKGGKAVACFMAIFGGSSWLGFIISLAVFFTIFLVVFKKVMSKASLLSGAVLICISGLFYLIDVLTHAEFFNVILWDFGLVGGVRIGWEMLVAEVIVYVLLVIRHASNIARIKKGEEKPLEWK